MKKTGTMVVAASAAILAILALMAACLEPVGAGGSSGEGDGVSSDEPQRLIDIEHNGSKGAAIAPNYGFFIESYPGSTLGSVELLLSSANGGDAEIELIASLNNYLGSGDPEAAELGRASTKVTLQADSAIEPYEWISFDFGALDVAPGELVVFEIEVISSSAGFVYYAQDANAAPPGTPSVIQTNGTKDIHDPNGVYDKRREPIPLRVVGEPAP
ncbi:MAG: hypothetical protein ACOC8L_01970 [Spirochaetota bacterium]